MKINTSVVGNDFYKVIHCVLIYDVIRKLVESFTERDVELLLLLLKSESIDPSVTFNKLKLMFSKINLNYYFYLVGTGMEIRKDDASSLKVGVLKLIHSDLALFSKLT